jgi:hypothetical protein
MATGTDMIGRRPIPMFHADGSMTEILLDGIVSPEIHMAPLIRPHFSVSEEPNIQELEKHRVYCLQRFAYPNGLQSLAYVEQGQDSDKFVDRIMQWEMERGEQR